MEVARGQFFWSGAKKIKFGVGPVFLEWCIILCIIMHYNCIIIINNAL